MGTQGSPVKSYDYLLKFLLVGDSDVGKGEILESLQDGAAESRTPTATVSRHLAPPGEPASAWPRAGAGRGREQHPQPRRGPRPASWGGGLVLGLRGEGPCFGRAAAPGAPGCPQKEGGWLLAPSISTLCWRKTRAPEGIKRSVHVPGRVAQTRHIRIAGTCLGFSPSVRG